LHPFRKAKDVVAVSGIRFRAFIPKAAGHPRGDFMNTEGAGSWRPAFDGYARAPLFLHSSFSFNFG
jgi:hypothetical protein